jgi:hypothetical protein
LLRGSEHFAAAQVHHEAQLSKSVTLNFVAESNDEGFEELMEEFAPLWRCRGAVLIALRHHCSCLRRRRLV